MKRLLSAVGICAILNACQTVKDPNTIQFSTWGSPEEMAILRPLIAEFEAQNPDIKVDVLHIPDKYFQKLHTLLAANLAPDVMFLNNINFPIYASNQSFMPLEPYLQNSTMLKSEDFYTQTLDGFKWNNQLLGLPRDASNIVVFYNQDLFDQNNVPYPTANWTYEEFLTKAKALTLDTNKDGQKDVFGVSFHKYFLFWTPYVWSFGGDLFNKERTTFTLNDPKAIEGIQAHADLRHKHHVAPTAAEQGSTSMAQMFIQGKLAMQLNGRWAVPLYRQNLKFRWDIAPFPAGPNGSVVDADASGWVIAKDTHAPDKAWKLVEFLASRKASEAFTKPGLIIPARKDVAKSEVFLSPGVAPQSSEVFLDALEKGLPTPAVPYWNQVIEAIDRSLEPVWDGTKTAQEALQGVEKEVEPLL